MSLTTLKKEWAEGALAPHAVAFLRAMEYPLKDETYLAIEPVLGGRTVMKEALDAFPIASADPDKDAFVIDLHRQFAGSVKVLTPKQCRAVANVLRCALRVGDPGTYQAPAPSTPSAVPAKVAVSRGPWYTGPATVLTAFVPKLNLDLSVLPETGRYALAPTAENGLASPWFVIIKQVRRPYSRRGRFVWGVSRRGYAEYIEKGRWEVRVQSGDTKDLIGEQKAGNVYHGTLEELVQEVLASPAEAMTRYGALLGVCSYCGRSLTDDLSRLRGIGPDCWENKHMPFVLARLPQALKAGV